MEPTHPAVTILNDLLGPEWSAVDLLVRDDQAAIVEVRRNGLRETHILVPRRGEWVAPGLLTRNSTQVPV